MKMCEAINGIRESDIMGGLSITFRPKGHTYKVATIDMISGIVYFVRLFWSAHETLVKRLYLIEAEWRIYASVTYPPLDQIMACRLAGAKPLFEPMLEYC